MQKRIHVDRLSCNTDVQQNETLVETRMKQECPNGAQENRCREDIEKIEALVYKSLVLCQVNALHLNALRSMK